MFRHSLGSIASSSSSSNSSDLNRRSAGSLDGEEDAVALCMVVKVQLPTVVTWAIVVLFGQ